MGYSLYLPALLLISLAISVCDSVNLLHMNVNLAYGVVKGRFQKFFEDVTEAERLLVDTTMDDRMKQSFKTIIERLKSHVTLMYQSFDKLTPPLHYGMHSLVRMTYSTLKGKFREIEIIVNKLKEHQPKFTTPSTLSPAGIFAKSIDDVKVAASYLMTLFNENYHLLFSFDKHKIRSVVGDANNKAKLYGFFYDKYYKDKPRTEENDASIVTYTKQLQAIIVNMEKLVIQVNDIKDKEQQKKDEEQKLIQTIVENLGIKSTDVAIIKKIQKNSDQLDRARADYAELRAFVARGRHPKVKEFKTIVLDMAEPEVEKAAAVLKQAIDNPNVTMEDMKKVSNVVSSAETGAISWLHMYGPKKSYK